LSFAARFLHSGLRPPVEKTSVKNESQSATECRPHPKKPGWAFLIVTSEPAVYTFGMLTKVLGFYTKYFGVWVVLFGVAAYCWPGPFAALKGYMDWFFALKHFGEKVAMPAAILVFTCVITASLMAALWRRTIPDEQPG